ncbi:hypothetical protein LP420_34455 [Massilia sp. B-10]|nr:hypothetical protein LP420_34455 [Massilia sp. B-10]
MSEFTSLRHIPSAQLFKKGDVFVLFGELFGRGYVNGLIDEARPCMTIVGITVGRHGKKQCAARTERRRTGRSGRKTRRQDHQRPDDGWLRPRRPGKQSKTRPKCCPVLPSRPGKKTSSTGPRSKPARAIGVRRFTESAAEVMGQIDKLIPDGANVFFAHTMAGGIPKIKAFLAIANRIYKGRGERFMSSRPARQRPGQADPDELRRSHGQHPRLPDHGQHRHPRARPGHRRQRATRPTATTAPRS